MAHLPKKWSLLAEKVVKNCQMYIVAKKIAKHVPLAELRQRTD
jgi:hypothetical protein